MLTKRRIKFSINIYETFGGKWIDCFCSRRAEGSLVRNGTAFLAIIDGSRDASWRADEDQAPWPVSRNLLPKLHSPQVFSQTSSYPTSFDDLETPIARGSSRRLARFNYALAPDDWGRRLKLKPITSDRLRSDSILSQHRLRGERRLWSEILMPLPNENEKFSVNEPIGQVKSISAGGAFENQ